MVIFFFFDDYNGGLEFLRGVEVVMDLEVVNV